MTEQIVVDWDLDGRIQACSFGKARFWVRRNICSASTSRLFGILWIKPQDVLSSIFLNWSFPCLRLGNKTGTAVQKTFFELFYEIRLFLIRFINILKHKTSCGRFLRIFRHFLKEFKSSIYPRWHPKNFKFFSWKRWEPEISSKNSSCSGDPTRNFSVQFQFCDWPLVYRSKIWCQEI